MNFKSALIYFAIPVLVIGLVFWWMDSRVFNKTDALDKRMSVIYSKFELSDSTITKDFTEIRTLGRKRYVHIYREYDVGRDFSWKSFQSAAKNRLDKTGFRIAGVDKFIDENVETYIVLINFKKFNILTIRINKAGRVIAPEVAAAQAVTAAPAVPAARRVVKRARVAIVIDDFGYTMGQIDQLFDIREPVTLSILPNLAHSREIASMAKERGYEVILHLPLEAHNKAVQEEVNTIRCGMKEREVIAKLKNEVDGIPGLTGVSNHTGSKATEDRALMTIILTYLKERGLYFFDSLTSEKSICGDAARKVGLRFAKRDMFLDNSSDMDDIAKNLDDLERLAFKRGQAIAICHDRKNTIAVLARKMPEMSRDGIDFVLLSDMVK